MKNLKNMFAWITLAVILTVGTVGVKADGIIVNGGADNQGCSENEGTLDGFVGIIVNGAPQFAGIIVNGAPALAGYYVHDAPCRAGVMIAD